MRLLFGLTLAYLLREFFLRAAGARGVWAYVLPCEAALGLGAAYELTEAGAASIVSPETGDAIVGMRGDIWDAQKDMAMGLAGAVATMALTARSGCPDASAVVAAEWPIRGKASCPADAGRTRDGQKQRLAQAGVAQAKRDASSALKTSR